MVSARKKSSKKASKKNNSKSTKKLSKKEEKFVQFCPICGSKDFGFFKSSAPLEVAAADIFKCFRCKNVFSFPVELPESKAKKVKLVNLSKEILKDTPSEAYTSLGQFQIRVYWKILAVIAFILAISSFYLSTLPFFCSTIEGEVICIANQNPREFILYGIALLFSSIYLFSESMFLLRYNDSFPRALRTILFLGLLIVIMFTGSSVLFMLP